MVARLPETSARLLANIPRLEGVARIVRYQHQHFDGSDLPEDPVKGEALPLGSRLLKILDDLAQLQAEDMNRREALEEMQSRLGWYDPVVLECRAGVLWHGPAQARNRRRPVNCRSPSATWRRAWCCAPMWKPGTAR